MPQDFCSKQIPELEISKEVLYFLLGQTITKLWMLKVGDQKKLRHFGSEATFFASLYDMYSESLLFGLPRFKKPEVQGHDMIFRGQNTPIYYMKCKRVVLICSVHTSSCRCSFWMTPQWRKKTHSMPRLVPPRG